MPSRVQCAGTCGQTIYHTTTSLPPGKAKCRPCRKIAAVAPDAVCPVCAAPFRSVLRSDGKWTQTCSKRCAQRLRVGPITSRTPRTCEVCAAIYQPSYGGRSQTQRTCGRACGAALQLRNKPPPPITYPHSRIRITECAVCESPFVIPPDKGTPRLCSDACRQARRAYYWARDKRRVAPSIVRHCECGAAIARTRRKCDGCVARSLRRRRLTSKARHRRSQPDLIIENYSLGEIAERDRYRCGLCHRKVAMTQAVPHPKAPTIDHVIPLARGGHDTRANVQLACFICNSRKGARGTQQLRLIG